MQTYLGVLKRVFDWAEVEPNPARWPNLRVPRKHPGHGQPDPPSLAEFLVLLEAMPAHLRDSVIVLEGDGDADRRASPP